MYFENVSIDGIAPIRPIVVPEFSFCNQNLQWSEVAGIGIGTDASSKHAARKLALTGRWVVHQRRGDKGVLLSPSELPNEFNDLIYMWISISVYRCLTF